MPKTIIVTGASSGIGKALAEHLAAFNHKVIAVARRKDMLEELLKLYPDNIKIVVADITKNEDRLKVKNAIDPNETGVFLIHNAGIATPRKLAELSEEEWDQHYLVNTKAPIFLTKLLLTNLKNGGRVLNISTGLAHNSMAAMSAYGVSKSALYMWKDYCNVELKDQAIAFGSAMPGVVDTAIQQEMRSYDSIRFPAVEAFKGFHQRDELLKPETVAKFLSWLLFKVERESFIKDEWDIYNVSHQTEWAASGEVKQRQSHQVKNWCSLFSSFAKSHRTCITAGAVAAGVAAVALINKFSH
jgi:short-subunit dehydrogenase